MYLVIGPAQKGDQVSILLDGKPIGDASGADVVNGKVLLDTQRLYNLVDLKGKPGTHRLRVEFVDPGTSVYAFTFG